MFSATKRMPYVASKTHFGTLARNGPRRGDDYVIKSPNRPALTASLSSIPMRSPTLMAFP